MPHPTVATIIERDDKFLLVYEWRNGHLLYNQPAGHLEPGEGLIEAACRETLEETRWQVQISAYLGVSVYLAPANGVSYVRHSFIGSPLREHPELPLDKGIEAAHWLSYEEIVALGDQLASPLVLQDIEAYRAGHRYPLDMVRCNLTPN